jgi:secreted PhoX family phosphatase
MRTLLTTRAPFLVALVAPLACADDVDEADDLSDTSEAGDDDDDDDDDSDPTLTTATGPDTSGSETTSATVDDSGPDTGTTTAATTEDDDDDDSSSSTTGEPPLQDTIPSVIRELIEAENGGTDIEGFPQEYTPDSGSLVVIPQLNAQIDVAFLDSLTDDDSPTAPTWGANNDFNAYLGDGWEEDGTPYYAGSGVAGWMFTNFEYLSNDRANVGAAPTGQGLQLVTWLNENGVAEFQFDVTDSAQRTAERVDAYILWHKRVVGAALYRVEYDETNGWTIDTSAANVRFDATSDTLFRVFGGVDIGIAQDDEGNDLPPNVVPGTSSNCSGGITPWGTIITAEENVNFSYGELQSCWNSSNALVSGPCNPGAEIVWNTAPSATADYTRGTVTNTRPSYYSYLNEIDPEAAPNEPYDETTGDGHLKLGSMGRANWENAAFHVGADWNLVPDQPIVFYAGDDRRGGRIYKWVSTENYTEGMSKAEIRNLLADGYVYAAHFADLDNSDDADTGALGGVTVGGALASEASPGYGTWVRLSIDNDLDVAPNAGGGGGAMTTVGEALTSVTWNGMGGFPDEQTVLMGLYSASNKIGIRELNRPEDVEWHPLDGTLWIAFTNHDRQNALRDDGTLNVDDVNTPENERDQYARSDDWGSIMVLTEADPADPGASDTFTFHTAWRGSAGASTFEAANPDNIQIDSEGGVWFGTDGNFAAATKQDAVYYLEVADDPTASRAWRIATMPSDAENTGPMFASDERTLFFSVQHPAEDLVAAPESDFAPFGRLGPRSGRVSLTLVER